MSASCSITGPYGEQDRIRSVAQQRARARARASPGELDPPRRRADREPDRDAPLGTPRPPSAGARASPRQLAGCTIVMSGKRAEQRDVADRLVRLPRAGRDQPGVVERVDDLRPLARLVVDLLVRARREERRERVDDGQQTVAREAGGGRDHVLLGDPALDEPIRDTRARTRARGSRTRDRRRGRRGPRAPLRAGRARRRTRRRRTRP